MPLPMVHLSVAVSLCEKDERFPSPDFLLGSIAPDAIHMRPDTRKDDKERVHLLELGASPQELVRLFQARYGKDVARSMGFSAGYLAHLLTDFLWRQAVIDPFRKKNLPTLPEKEIRSLYYRNTDQVDLDLYRQMPWRPQVWHSLKTAVAGDFPPLLTAKEITLWRDRTLGWFELHDHDPQEEPLSITLADTLDFVERAVKEIAGIFAAS